MIEYEIELNDSRMKVISYNKSLYIESDNQRFNITHISKDISRVNYLCDLYGKDRGVMATDTEGTHYICLLKPGEVPTKNSLIKFLQDNRDWKNSIWLVNKLELMFNEKFNNWLVRGSTLELFEMCWELVELDGPLTDFYNTVLPLDTARHLIERGDTLPENQP